MFKGFKESFDWSKKNICFKSCIGDSSILFTVQDVTLIPLLQRQKILSPDQADLTRGNLKISGRVRSGSKDTAVNTLWIE